MIRVMRWLPLFMLFFLLVTNRWPGWEEGISLLSAADVKYTYLPVAKASPELPNTFSAPHQAQRFFFPYIVGLISSTTGAPLAITFWTGTIALQVLVLVLFWSAAHKLGASDERRLLAFGLLVFQPYFLRYYWIVPAMGGDVLFELGAVMVIASSVMVQLIGFTLSTLGRQTSIMLLPGAFYLLWRSKRFGNESFRNRILVAVSYLGSFGIAFWAARHVGSRFSSGELPASTIYGILPWLLTEFNFSTFLEHTVRCFLPLLPVGALFLFESPTKWRHETRGLLLFGAGIAAQPFVAGPLLTGQNAARLSTLALLPITLAWVSMPGNKWGTWKTLLALILLAAGSFHHLYTIVGFDDSKGTASLQFVVALGVFSVGYSVSRGSQNAKVSN